MIAGIHFLGLTNTFVVSIAKNDLCDGIIIAGLHFLGPTNSSAVSIA